MAKSKRRYSKKSKSRHLRKPMSKRKRIYKRRRVSKRKRSKKKQRGRGYSKLFKVGDLIGKEAVIQGYGLEYHPNYTNSELMNETNSTGCELKFSKAMPMCHK